MFPLLALKGEADPSKKRLWLHVKRVIPPRRTLADTPFPFPWAQAVLLMLLIFSFTVPLLMVAYVERLWLAVLLDIVTVQSYCSLNEVARDLEDPFVFEPNDLPLARLQVVSLPVFSELLITTSSSRGASESRYLMKRSCTTPCRGQLSWSFRYEQTPPPSVWCALSQHKRP